MAALSTSMIPGALLGAQAPTSGGDGRPAVVSQGRVDPRRDVNFSALALPSTVYVGQQVTYQIGVFLSEDVSQRLRRNPEFVPPDVRSMLAYDLPSPARPLQRVERGRAFDVHVFQRALFPLTPGSHALAPARLTYSLPLSNTFFSREETHSARTSALTVIAREPPATGRPSDYAGAVGRIALSARVDTPSSRVGEPVTLVVSVRGIGNVSLFPRPLVRLPWGDAVNGAEFVAIDSGTLLVQGRKDFEWVVTPRREGALQVPALRYPYWNPYTEQYEVAVTAPLPLTVTGGTLASPVVVASDSVPRLTIRTRYRGALRPPLTASPVLWAALGFAPLPALLLGLARRPRRARRERADAPLRRIEDAGLHTPADLRRAFSQGVTGRTGVGGSALTDGRALVRSLRRVGVEAATAQRAQLVLAEIDRATYGGGEGRGDLAEMARRAADTYRAIDAEAIPVGGATSRAGRRAASGGAMALLLVTGIAVGDEARDAQQFAEGVTAYASGNYTGAMRAFHDVGARVPRAADAWANLGTAAWYAGDSATAAVGWQRALRLEPLAADVRVRLEATPGFRAGALGDVPPIPLDAAAALGALLWIGAWGTLAWGAVRGRRGSRTPALVAMGCGAMVGLATIELARVLSGRDHYVVVSTGRLHSAPALGAEVASDVMSGEAAEAIGAQGVWTRLRFPDGRSGWLETRRLASLDLTRAP